MSPRLGRPGVAAISFAGTGGGLAYVARLLRHTLGQFDDTPVWTASLDPARYGRVSTREGARFASRVAAAQVFGRVGWLAFNHVGIARIQRLIPRAMRRPYVVFVHDVEAWDPALPADRLRALSAAWVRVANSRYTAERVSQAHPDIGAVTPCPLGLMPRDPEGDAPSIAPAGLAPGGAEVAGAVAGREVLDRITLHAVLIVGRMQSTERYKGHDELLDAWPAVVARVADAQLVVVGLGDDRARLEARARALGVASQVLFCGFLSAPVLAELWKRVAVFAMPSAREGFGLVYLEAMRAGRPCIGSTSDAAGDIIVDGQTGLLVDRSNRVAVTEAVVTLLRDESMRRAMGEAGRRRFAAEFTAERFAARLRAALAHPTCQGGGIL